MSRTDAHAPFFIRVARGDVARREAHEHADGMCDLPDSYDPDALWQGRGHCHWEWIFAGHYFCSCEMCHGGTRLRAERRADRQRTSRILRVAADRWNAGEDDDLDVS